MGFLSGLGKVLSIGGGIAAAPFTGGASLIPAIISGAGAIASGIGSGRAAGRVQETGINQNQDLVRQRAAALLEQALQNRAQLDTQQRQFLENALQNRQQLGLSQQQFLEGARQNRGQLDLQQRQFALNAPAARARNAARGDTMANIQDLKINAGPRVKIPEITGGLRPSLLGANSRATGKEISRQALMQQMEGDHFAPMGDLPEFGPMGDLPTFSGLPAPNIPGVTPMPQANGLDNTLNIVGGVGAGTGIISELLKNRYKAPSYKAPVIQPTGPTPWDEEGVG